MRILAAPSPRAAPLLIALGLAWPFTATADAVASATLSLHEVITRAVQMAPPQRLADESLRSEEHTSELQSLMRHSYDVFCLNKKKTTKTCLVLVKVYLL